MPNLANRLQFKDFRLIRAICDTGQLALAAEQLVMTQPAASRTLAAIESAVGMPLFTRHPKGMEPTVMGELLARNATGLLSDLDETLQQVRAVGVGRAGRARVGAVTGGAVAFVVPAIAKLKETAAQADIHVDVAPSVQLIDGLMRGEYDFVLSRIPPGVDPRQFTIRRGRVEIIRFLVRNGHPLAGRRRVKLEELSGFEWVIQGPQMPLRQAVEDAFVSNGLPLPDEIVNTTSLLVMIAYLSSMDALAPMSNEVAQLLGPSGVGSTLVAIDLEEPLVLNPYHLVSRRNQMISPLAQQLRELVFAGLSGEARR